MTPAQLVSCIDFHHITDALTRDEALAILERQAASKVTREAELLERGYPAYTTSVGWLGYSDEKIHRLCEEALAEGWTHFKVKVGGKPEDDLRRLSAVRAAIGPAHKLMIDSNQRWDVEEAIRRIKELSHLDLWWAEEPTHPDDVLGHARIAKAIAPVGVATGEHAANRVIFKQLLQANAITFCQIDSCRLGGVNENLAVMLMAAKFGVRVCPHAGGVGLCEYVQHLSMFDFIAIAGSMDGRVIEFVDHLHEHFEEPVDDPARALPGTHEAGVQHHDQAGFARQISVSRRGRLGRVTIKTYRTGERHTRSGGEAHRGPLYSWQ